MMSVLIISWDTEECHPGLTTSITQNIVKTEFRVPGGKKKLYLSAIIDLYDRYPITHVIIARNDNKLVFKTFDKAIAAKPDAKPIFHSVRGFQYTGKMFKKKLEKQDMELSMSQVGHCIDNGPTEGFLWDNQVGNVPDV